MIPGQTIQNYLRVLPPYLNPVNNLKTVFAILSMLQAVTAIIGGRCTHFNSSFGTSPPFFWSWRNVNNSALFPSQTDGHILPTTVPRPLVTVAGLGGGHMPPAGCFYTLVGRKKFFGCWHCSPSRMQGQPFSHCQGASQYLKQPLIQRGRAQGAEKRP